MPDAQKYTGSCHCGAVRYTVTTDLAQVIDCNCSICRRRGHILTFVAPEAIDIESSDDAVTTYQFGGKNIEHLFCSTCGVNAYGSGVGPDGKRMFAVNVRCLDGVDLGALAVHHYDGASL